MDFYAGFCFSNTLKPYLYFPLGAVFVLIAFKTQNERYKDEIWFRDKYEPSYRKYTQCLWDVVNCNESEAANAVAQICKMIKLSHLNQKHALGIPYLFNERPPLFLSVEI